MCHGAVVIHLLAAEWGPQYGSDPFELLGPIGPIGLVLVLALISFTVVIMLGRNHRKTLERRRQEHLALQRLYQQQQKPQQQDPPLH
jgi:hypothetical protein